jgi:hypothetical protein
MGKGSFVETIFVGGMISMGLSLSSMGPPHMTGKYILT